MKNIELTSNVCGYYKLSIKRKNGSIDDVTDWFKNIITNQGLDYFGSSARSSMLSYCQVGTGTTTPSQSDIALSSLLASTNSKSVVANASTTSSPYYNYLRIQYSFATGGVTGNITEIGTGWGLSSSLFSRSLILDGSGNPTSITVLSDEQLIATYELRMSMPTSDLAGSITLNSISYTWTSRAASVTSSAWNVNIDSSTGEGYGVASGQVSHDVTISAITSSPAGNISLSSSCSSSLYSNGNYYRDHTISFGPSQGVFAGGIGSIVFNIGSCSYQIGFSPFIPKTNIQTLSFTIRHSWARS